MELIDLLNFAGRSGASDVHLSPTNPPIFRVNGDMTRVESPPLAASDIKNMLYSVMSEQQKSEFEKDLEIDFAISFGSNMRFRVNFFHGLNGESAVLRTIPTQIKSLESLGAPEIFKKISNLHKGLVLVTGPTGSGKSTTLAAMVDYINSTSSRHIITIEDPIEFVHKSKNSLVNQREVGENTRSFARALKSVLREDPDVILVGEMRDLETIQLAITAAETGHLVMGTLHTSSAPKTIDRIIDVFPSGSQDMIRSMLSVSLEAVITQALLKKSDGSGRVAAYEILLGTPAVRNLIREGKVPQLSSAMQTGVKIGMRLMRDAVAELVDKGLVSSEEAKRVIATANSESDEFESGSTSNSGSGGGVRPLSSAAPINAPTINSPYENPSPQPLNPLSQSKNYSGF